MEKLWWPEQVSDFVGVPIRTLYAWRTRGEGPRAFKVGRHLRYSQAEVERWLEERGSKAT